MRVCIFGAGYVGLVNALVLASRGHEVLVVEKDREKLELLRSRALPFFEPCAQDLLTRFFDNLRFEREYAGGCEIAFICVDTPLRRLEGCDLGGVYACAKQVHDAKIVLRSTVPPGTCAALSLQIGRMVCYMPEFLTQSAAVQSVLNPDRLIVGTEDMGQFLELFELYKDENIIVMSTQEAELCKLACNSYLAVRLSYINQLANLCEVTGANYDMVARGMGADHRIGSEYLQASAGYGGSCLPKDAGILLDCARQKNSDFVMLGAAIAANERQKIRLALKARRYYASFRGLNAAVLGAAFKEGSDDIRNSVAVELIDELVKQGAKVRVYDRLCAKKACAPFLGVSAFDAVEDCLMGADLCFVLHQCDAVADLEPKVFARAMKTPLVIDAKRCFDKKTMEAAGVTYEAIGI